MSFTLFIEPYAKVAVNVVVTFVQAGFATWAVTGFATDKATIGAAVGAGLSIVWNTLFKPYLVKQGWLKA